MGRVLNRRRDKSSELFLLKKKVRKRYTGVSSFRETTFEFKPLYFIKKRK